MEYNGVVLNTGGDRGVSAGNKRGLCLETDAKAVSFT